MNYDRMAFFVALAIFAANRVWQLFEGADRKDGGKQEESDESKNSTGILWKRQG